MPRRKLKENSIRKITRLGGSLVVSIPREEVDTLKWREKQKVVVKRVGKKIIISDWKK